MWQFLCYVTKVFTETLIFDLWPRSENTGSCTRETQGEVPEVEGTASTKKGTSWRSAYGETEKTGVTQRSFKSWFWTTPFHSKKCENSYKDKEELLEALKWASDMMYVMGITNVQQLFPALFPGMWCISFPHHLQNEAWSHDSFGQWNVSGSSMCHIQVEAFSAVFDLAHSLPFLSWSEKNLLSGNFQEISERL